MLEIGSRSVNDFDCSYIKVLYVPKYIYIFSYKSYYVRMFLEVCAREKRSEISTKNKKKNV